MGNGLIQIIILVGVAGFLFFRLRDAFGRKTGHENPDEWFGGAKGERPDRLDNAPAEEEDKIVRFPAREGKRPEADIAAIAPLDSETGRALLDARRVEPGFDPAGFASGAESAYEMVLTAFENGDKETLRNLLADDVYASFASVIDDRRAKNYTVDSRFVGLSRSAIEAARFDPETEVLDIDVRFEAEMITAVRDESGAVVQGDPTAVRKLSDLWTFTRRMGTPDPNWTLTATGD